MISLIFWSISKVSSFAYILMSALFMKCYWSFIGSTADTTKQTHNTRTHLVFHYINLQHSKSSVCWFRLYAICCVSPHCVLLQWMSLPDTVTPMNIISKVSTVQTARWQFCSAQMIALPATAWVEDFPWGSTPVRMVSSTCYIYLLVSHLHRLCSIETCTNTIASLQVTLCISFCGVFLIHPTLRQSKFVCSIHFYRAG
jgi:hypothetical protein